MRGSIFAALLLSTPIFAAPTNDAASSSSTTPDPSTTGGVTSDAPNSPAWDESFQGTPQPIDGDLGASVLGPHNLPLELEAPDFVLPPTTDHGSVDNAKWPFALSHNRIQTGGWARQQNNGIMPIASALAGVNMRLKAGAVRELHWHSTAEWAYVLKGTTRITAVNADGQNYIADVNAGDVWYFPPGIPHSLQGLNDSSVDGTEFLLVFDSGSFSEDATFLLTDWLAHVPKEILAKNFNVNISAFDHIPANELYIFPSAVPPPISQNAVADPSGTVPHPFSFALSQVNATKLPGGSVKILDSTTFNVSQTIAAAEVTVEVGGMRELHWHPTEPEWSYFLEGQGRVTLFAAQSNARTFDYQAGDIGYVPPSFGHYVENTGNTTLKYLEIFASDRYQDISLNQWLALTPPDLVKAHLGFDDDTINALDKTKQTVVGAPSS
ncbi:oxalate decarboxylase [Sistotremastrum niveocremeum HHB9708]|uniref:Oxalate decarboxylase n=2 Tax=Sistotremastraceae TaxID=3402574 RepID=A0A164TQK5_9AGAM|nr:oxalate decarboxylase [Sistotremastrum niveocremeum HHB9708]KZT42226.1 oxalate oxidase [Sistotremastrum suecicum HHB10207 ss-3]